MKFKYGGWITSFPEIIVSGNYSLNPIISPSNNCFKIAIKNSSEYLILEYRNKSGTFESSIPNSGLLVYRINENYQGNANGIGGGGITDEVYIFRPNWDVPYYGSVTFANLSSESGRTSFHNNSNPYGFVSDMSFANIYIKNISYAGSTISFDVRFCDGENVTYSNTNSIPAFTNASNNITTSGTVTILGTNNATFEAVNEVTLNAGFEIQQGGIFEINMNGCGDQ